MTISALNTDVFFKVCNFLNPKQICAIVCVCKNWKQNLEDTALFKEYQPQMQLAVRLFSTVPEEYWQICMSSHQVTFNAGTIDFKKRYVYCECASGRLVEMIPGKLICRWDYGHRGFGSVFFRVEDEGPINHAPLSDRHPRFKTLEEREEFKLLDQSPNVPRWTMESRF